MPETDMLTVDLFAALVQRLLASGSSNRWLLQSESFTLVSDTSDGQTALPLSELHQSFSASSSPANLLELQKQLRSMLAPPARSDVLSNLLPNMRSFVSLQQENVGDEMVIFPYADVLGVGLALEMTGTPRQISYSDLDHMGLSAEEAIEIAVENLSRISMEPFRLVQPGFYASPWKDSYDGARLLLTDLFTNLQVEGDVVAINPTPETLIITGSSDLAGMELLMSLNTILMKESNANTALPLVLRDGMWTSFVVPPTDPSFDAAHTYRMQILNLLYGDQERHLVQKMGGSNIFVSPFVLDKDRSTGYIFSKTSIEDGYANSFPECDIVEFYKLSTSGKKYCAARAPFSTVVEQLSTLLEDRNLRPKRWGLPSFPQPAELASLSTMSPGRGVWSTQQTDRETREKAEMEAKVRMPIPDDAQLTLTSYDEEQGQILEFHIPTTTEELTEFYLTKLKVGNAIAAPTKQGRPVIIVEAVGAASTREARIGPGEVEGESVLKLIKRVNYDTPAVQNVFVKQSDRLLAFEQLFGISLLPQMKAVGSLTLTTENASQRFEAPYLPDVVVQFFRTQMFGPNTVFTAADRVNPHSLVNMDAGLIATISPETTIEGTASCTLSQALKR